MGVSQMMNGISIGEEGRKKVEKSTTTIMNHLQYKKKREKSLLSLICAVLSAFVTLFTFGLASSFYVFFRRRGERGTTFDGVTRNPDDVVMAQHHAMIDNAIRASNDNGIRFAVAAAELVSALCWLK